MAKETFIDPLSERFELLAAPETIDFPLLVIVLMVACIAVSALGSGITLRRFLRVWRTGERAVHASLDRRRPLRALSARH